MDTQRNQLARIALNLFDGALERWPTVKVPRNTAIRMEAVRAALNEGLPISDKLLLATGDYSPIRSAYVMEIGGIMNEYLRTPDVKVTKYLSMFKRAIVSAFYPAFEQGLIDGGGEAPAKGEDLRWINAKVQAEFGFAKLLFEALKELKTEGPEAWAGVPEQRAEAYAKTLDGVYSEGKIRGGADVLLVFDGQDGEESCKTCQRWKGKVHKASFWKKRGLIPGQPGNSAFECGGWNCQHRLYNAKTGEIWTV